MSVLDYVRQFDQLSRYASDMVQTETSKVWRFLSGLHLSLAGLVDIGSDGLESYANAIWRATRQESWMKTEKNVNMGTGEGLKEAIQLSPLQVYGNQRSGRRLGSQSRKPNNQDKTSRSGGSLKQAVRGKVGQETRVDLSSSEGVNKLDGILSNGHFVTSVKDGMIH